MSDSAKSAVEVLRTLWKTPRIECHLVRVDGKTRVLEVIDRAAWVGTKAESVVKVLAQHGMVCPVIEIRRTGDKIRVQSRPTGRPLSAVRNLPLEETDHR